MEDDRSFLSGLTVLLVEDDATVRAHAAQLLGRCAGRVLQAEDGSAGLAAFQAHGPDLVVTDLLMPGIDGLAMAEAIRRIRPQVPIVVITAVEDAPNLIRSINLGIDRYVLKPVDPEVLEGALRHCARRLRGERELEAQARRQQELLEARHQAALGILAAGVARDFDDLLQSLVAAAFLAKAATQRGESPAQFFEQLEKGYLQAKELSQRLLLLDPNRRAVHPRTDLRPLLQETITRTLAGTRTRLVLDLPADLPEPPISPSLMGKVFANLASNAAEAMDGQGTLEVRAEAVEIGPGAALPLAAGRYLHLAFKDGGRGIPSQRMATIFDPYATSKARGQTKGLGLGLAVCRAVMAVHHGDIAAVSEPGAGATFHLHLPLPQDLFRDA